MSADARGFLLVEAAVLLAVVGVALAGMLLALTRASSADPLLRRQALYIAEALLDEVERAPFSSCPDGSGCPRRSVPRNRADFAHVDDYRDFRLDGGIRDAGDFPIAGLENYRARVTVAAQRFAGIPAADARRIVVTVDGPADVRVTLEGWRTRRDDAP